MASPEKKKTEITEKEFQVLALAWKCFKTPPDVDTVKLAKLAGYSNPRSVANLLSVVKKKLAAATPDDGGAGDVNADSAPATPSKRTPKPQATPALRKRKIKVEDDGTDAGPVTPTPTKRARGSKKAAAAAVVKDEPDEDQEDGARQEVSTDDEAIVD
ncbi:hypothetical protein AAE478_009084 [Parahypoxylon ruwenzoriense]